MALASVDPVSTGQAAAAVMAALVLMFVPGYGLLRRFAPGSDWLLGLAAGPAVTAGLLYVVGEVMTLADVPVNWVLGLIAVAAGALAAGLASRAGNRGEKHWDRLLVVALAVAFLLGAVIWIAGIGHLGAVPPHNDGLNHGFFTTRIDVTGSLAPSHVLVSDVVRGGSAVQFYPLALHQQAAMVMQATGADAGFAFTLVSLLYAGIGLPAGMALLTRRLFPAMPTAPAAAAVLSAAVPALPYSTSWWGGYAMAAGLAVVPAAVLLVLGCGERRSVGWGVLASFAVAGTAGIHTSELPLIPITVAFLLLGRTSRPEAPGWWARTLWSSGAMAAALVLLAPALSQMAGGYDERQYPVPDQILPFGRALAKVALLLQFVDPPTPAALVLAFWVGLVATFVLRRARAWSALWLTFGALFIWLAAAPSSLNVQLTAVWYSDPFRLAYILAFLAIPLAAFTFSALVETGMGLTRAEPDPAGGTERSRESRSSFTVLPRLALPAAAVLGVALVVPAAFTSVQTIRNNYHDYSLVSTDSRRAFAFLQEHVGAGEHVLNQRQDGSPWMYPLAGVAPLVALKTVDWDGPAWADRLYAAEHADELLDNQRVQRIFEEYDIRYVYVAPRIFDTDERLMRAEDLAASRAFREVFRSGAVQVFEVVR